MAEAGGRLPKERISAFACDLAQAWRLYEIEDRIVSTTKVSAAARASGKTSEHPAVPKTTPKPLTASKPPAAKAASVGDHELRPKQATKSSVATADPGLQSLPSVETPLPENP